MKLNNQSTPSFAGISLPTLRAYRRTNNKTTQNAKHQEVMLLVPLYKQVPASNHHTTTRKHNQADRKHKNLSSQYWILQQQHQDYENSLTYAIMHTYHTYGPAHIIGQLIKATIRICLSLILNL